MPVERTVSRWRDGKWQSLGENLADLRSVRAYILLGEAGAGKTTAFKKEAKRDERALHVPARHFLRCDLDSHPEWRNLILLVDGLDEERAGGGDLREPLNTFIRRIRRLGKPRFRLSCREDSWLQTDYRELESITDGTELQLFRLDPLSGREARGILTSMGVKDPEALLYSAIDSGLEVFLQNPLFLEMLAETRGFASRSGGQLATFEEACSRLAEERNPEHRDAWDGTPFTTEESVLAAGRLCAIVLLSGKSGWSRRGAGNDEFPPVSEAGQPQNLLKFALDSKLFEGSVETGRWPRHRRIAEFLAAQYLDRAIAEEHLIASRVLALMTGVDGIVMPDLQGVSVWLAAMNQDVRGRLIADDPVGVAFHGDAGRFGRRETDLLLDGLERSLSHRGEWALPAALGAMMAGPAREILWEMLRAADRSHARQELVELLLRGIAVAPLADSDAGGPGLRQGTARAREILPRVVRDPSWRSTTRHWAMVALIHMVGEETKGVSILHGLLRDLDSGKVPEDERGELRGELLTFLYPRHFGSADIWNHAGHIWGDASPRSGAPSPVPKGKAQVFWTEHLVDESAPGDVRTLIDALIARARELIFLLAQNEVESVVLRLLARGLELFGEELDVAELYEWFELVEADYERIGLVPAHCNAVVLRSHHGEEQQRIYRWLRDHPDIQLALILEGLKRHAAVRRDTALDHRIGVKFLGDEAPPGFRGWCLEMAVELAAMNPRASIELANWAVVERAEWGRSLGDEEVLAAVRRVPLLLEWHERRIVAEAEYAKQATRLRESPQYIEVRERRQAYVASVREQLESIEAGQGPLAMLHDLGRVYVNGLEAGGAEQARADLELRVGSDQELLEAVIRGFRRLAERGDLPTLDDIIQLREKGKMSYFALPFLAGLIEDEREGADLLERLDEEGVRRALGFYLLSRLPTRSHPIPGNFSYEKDCRPRWYRKALQTNPKAVAEAFVAVHRARVHTKSLPDQHMYDLARAEEYAEVARLAVPGMFTPFPSRCAGEDQLEALRQALLAAIRYMRRAELHELVQRRLARRRMDDAQRAQWLATGALVAPDDCLPKLVDFVSEGEEQRVIHLIDFLVPDREPLPGQEWPADHLAALIKAVGQKLYSPLDDRHGSSDQFMAGESFATSLKAFPLVTGWVKTLAGRVDDESITLLAGLADDPTLTKWRGMLLRARDGQAEKHRVSTYRAPTLREIRDALSGGPPANAADLAALVTDKLWRLADRIRNGSTDDWLQYWHTDKDDPKGRKVIKPKPEGLCRKHLLSDLQLLLEAYGIDVDASPEGHHAEDTRSDILVLITSRGVHAVVVEVRKTDSRDLWSAIEKQLTAQYLRDPRSGGYGIYLVFWFGAGHLKSSPPEGTRPESPEELRETLKSLIPPGHRRTISVVVVDVTAPAGRLVSASRASIGS